MNKTLGLIAVAAVAAFAACEKSEFEGYTRAENGLNYKFYTHDENGVKPVEGDGIGIRYIIKVKSKDSVLVDSRQVSRDGSGVTNFILPKSSFLGSVEDAMAMMAVGDSASFIVSADSFFLKTNRMQALPPFIKPGEKLQVEMKMVEVKSKKEIEENRLKQEAEVKKLADTEKPARDQYIADNKITVAPTASGIYFIETKKGSGPKVKAGDQVKVNYTGKLLNGTVFDSSEGHPEPFSFVVGQGNVIPGWDEALQLMNKGSKATVVIPSMLAYGPQGSGPIPPFSTLVFDIEVLSVTPASK